MLDLPYHFLPYLFFYILFGKGRAEWHCKYINLDRDVTGI